MDDGLRKMLERNEARAPAEGRGGWRRREVAQPDDKGIPYLSNDAYSGCDNTPICPIIFLSYAYVELAASSLLRAQFVITWKYRLNGTQHRFDTNKAIFCADLWGTFHTRAHTARQWQANIRDGRATGAAILN